MDGVPIVIPVRRDSARLPRKALQVVGNCTLLERAIRTCQAVSPGVWVYSNCPDVLALSHLCGAKPRGRPESLSRADTCVWDTLRALLRSEPWLATREMIVMAQVTAPLMSSADIAGVIEAVDAGARMATCSVSRESWHAVPIGMSWAWEKRQTVELAGSCWAIRVSHLMSGAPIDCADTLVPAAVNFPLDIDTPDDLEAARILLAEPPVPLPQVE